jgi:hypothetical protein
MNFAINTGAWGWQQWFMVCNYAILLAIAAVAHGEKRPPWSFPAVFIGAVVDVFVLGTAGFFR